MKSSKLWVASVALLVSVFTTTVSRSDEPTSSDGWTKAQLIECRQWAAYYWAWRDTGQIPPGAEEFNFTFEVGKGFNPLLPTIYLFTQLYAGQLSVDYSILDLINDDGKFYLIDTMTGQVFGPSLTVEHLISQAWKVLKSDEYENTDPLIHWSVESPRPRTLKNCAPWYTDAERRQQIKDCLGITDDSQYLPDDF